MKSTSMTVGLVLLSALPELPGVVQLAERREAIAAELVQPIASCFGREDTRHAAFHGCVDWHSAVHAGWALAAYTRLTGDRRYEKPLRAGLTPEAIAAERALLRSNPGFEMPYGRAWFLRLAVEFERAFDDDLLTAMADDVARSLMDHYTLDPPRPFSHEYDNASWALLNLLEYGRFRNDERLVRFVSDAVRQVFVPGVLRCPIEDEGPEFMAICTNWAWLVSEVIPREEFLLWLERFLPADLEFSPVLRPRTAHEYGMNFSRSWGLWALYRETGDVRFGNAFVSNFSASYDNRDHWAGDYRRVAHWVAQFGMNALVPLWEVKVPQ